MGKRCFLSVLSVLSARETLVEREIDSKYVSQAERSVFLRHSIPTLHLRRHRQQTNSYDSREALIDHADGIEISTGERRAHV